MSDLEVEEAIERAVERQLAYERATTLGFGRRLGAALGFLLIRAVGLSLGLVALWLGYWFSDVLYDAGWWPVGAFLRVMLIIGALGWIFGLLQASVMFVVLLLRKRWEP